MQLIAGAVSNGSPKMDREHLIARLREHESELKAAGIEHLSLHGSYARGTAVRELSPASTLKEPVREKKSLSGKNQHVRPKTERG